jgi:hypothetical protein
MPGSIVEPEGLVNRFGRVEVLGEVARRSIDLPLTRLTDEAATETANAISPANRMKKRGPSASPAAAKLAPTM